jgi:hypothetical protein
MKVDDMSEAELETFYRRALNEGANERDGDTKADIVRRHFGNVMPDDEGAGRENKVDSRPVG